MELIDRDPGEARREAPRGQERAETARSRRSGRSASGVYPSLLADSGCSRGAARWEETPVSRPRSRPLPGGGARRLLLCLEAVQNVAKRARERERSILTASSDSRRRRGLRSPDPRCASMRDRLDAVGGALKSFGARRGRVPWWAASRRSRRSARPLNRHERPARAPRSRCRYFGPPSTRRCLGNGYAIVGLTPVRGHQRSGNAWGGHSSLALETAFELLESKLLPPHQATGRCCARGWSTRRRGATVPVGRWEADGC